MSSVLRCLEYNPKLVPEGGQVVLRQVSALSKLYGKDAAGVAFHHLALKQRGLIEDNDDSEEDSGSEEEVEATVSTDGNGTSARDLNDHELPPGTRWKKVRKPKNEVVQSSEKDYYKLLGLEQERWLATEDQILKAYRKTCLKMHPDKVAAQSEEKKLAAEEKFKEIQHAYEVLSNETSRRLYDSMDAFDDTLPAECNPEDFIKVYGPAFRRYSKWSVNKTVPDLGDEETPWTEVSLFYDFWFAFKSWREFPHPDEEDPSQAECREHKRWIERQNAKLREKAKKDEGKRIREFVDSAYKIDPRVTQHREAEKKERLRRKQEKQIERQKAEDAERELAEKQAALEEEAARVKQQQLEQEKKAREEEKRVLKEQRKRLRDLCQNISEQIDLDLLCANLDTQKLEKLSNFLEKEEKLEKKKSVLKQSAQALHHQLEEANKKKAAEQDVARKAFEESRKQEKKAKKVYTEWSEEELRMLDKALKKFPQGTRKRWEQVTDYIRTRTLDEVLVIVKEKQGASNKRFELQQNWRAPQQDREIASNPTKAEESFTDVQMNRADKVVTSSVSGDWTKEQEVALVKALKVISKDVPDRWVKIAEQVEDKTKAECFLRFKELRETFRSKKESLNTKE